LTPRFNANPNGPSWRRAAPPHIHGAAPEQAGSNSERPMSPEERQLLAGMFERNKANSAGRATQEAEAFINARSQDAASAPYLLAQP